MAVCCPLPWSSQSLIRSKRKRLKHYSTIRSIMQSITAYSTQLGNMFQHARFELNSECCFGNPEVYVDNHPSSTECSFEHCTQDQSKQYDAIS